MCSVGTQAALGVAPPSEALLFIICSPVGPYYPQGFKPVSLYGTTEWTRASRGGTKSFSFFSFFCNPKNPNLTDFHSCILGIGSFKAGANYAPGVMVQKEVAKLGYAQNLWLYGPEHLITEVGTMNAFAAFKLPDGSASGLGISCLFMVSNPFVVIVVAV